MDLDSKFSLKLPAAYDGLVVRIHNHLDNISIRASQYEPVYVDGKWFLDVVLEEDSHLKLVPGAGRVKEDQPYNHQKRKT